MKPLVAITRGNYIESVHYGYICIVDINKDVVYHLGEDNTHIFLRSSAKPFQAIPLVESGAIERYHITHKELAAICSSHSGELFHRETVYSILNKIELTEMDLDCGITNPYNPEMNEELIRKKERPSPLYNCCSGKHAGILALCRYYGFPTLGYSEIHHPAQQLIKSTIVELLQCGDNDIEIATDGCGIPNFMMSMKNTAFLYALLASGNKSPCKHREAIEKIKKAILLYPEMINGDGEFCTELMIAGRGKVIGKVGGEGVYCIGIPDMQLGIAIKVADGNERAIYPIAVHLLEELGVLEEEAIKSLSKWRIPPIKNHKGKVIGYTIPLFSTKRNIIGINTIGSKFNWREGLL